MKPLFIVTVASLACVFSTAVAATPAKFISVNAPNAQKLVSSVAATHPEAKLLCLHADVPSAKVNAIIGSNDLARLGKVSSPHDLEVIGKPALVTERADKKGVYEMKLPVNDRDGRVVGMMVEQIAVSDAKNEVDALAKAVAVRGEIEQGILNTAWLFHKS
ncbi:hypothetical protein [Neokomagataea anthophila]|uniref:Uncharacterized protein n=1 Tax=Neokomagataea anthophila TaxID=2826925 RepID=A0ABS5E973_9PROT|nr:hypothetical protein [Neokomagataea anthophila]MBR0560456.1 hypothetical protein [Neokomagataea anthophila]